MLLAVIFEIHILSMLLGMTAHDKAGDDGAAQQGTIGP
jgi:hypothetical protein